PNYFPRDVGVVGGLVGMLGALGGFVLPPVFGQLGRWTGVPQTAFLALVALSGGSLVWLHLAVLRLRAAERAAVAAEWPAASPPLPPGPFPPEAGGEGSKSGPPYRGREGGALVGVAGP